MARSENGTCIPFSVYQTGPVLDIRLALAVLKHLQHHPIRPRSNAQACTIYVITGGAVASPQTLKRTLRNRMSRAAMRTFGLEALAALIRILAPDGVVDASIGAQSAIQVGNEIKCAVVVKGEACPMKYARWIDV